ncbi:hypothetical protein [Galbitalea soli]|uniref:Uncharacterized protein n=1 Tax=Galbitalea soli TaxID=1268042 RepID=A0A7C9TPY5_9MICO|nr:hypothetical protein [Galbitalea soli]NEM91057.1 hypothetical protein [Galbitalea soli]NYJ29745.1 hypothetical protein [Galbitalea soli]
MNEPDDYRLSVADSLEAFRSGLVALTPSAERIGITWRDAEMHDDWELAADGLYTAFVAHPLQQDTSGTGRAFPLPRYDFNLRSYEKLSWLELTPSRVGHTFVFVRFSTTDEAFDTAEFSELESLGTEQHGYVMLPAVGLDVRLRQRYPDGTSRLTSDVVLVE